MFTWMWSFSTIALTLWIQHRNAAVLILTLNARQLALALHWSAQAPTESTGVLLIRYVDVPLRLVRGPLNLFM